MIAALAGEAGIDDGWQPPDAKAKVVVISATKK